MPHPTLQGLDVADMILQVAGRKRMPEFVQEEIRAVRPLRAFVAVFRNALSAIHFRVERDAFQFELVALSGLPDSFGNTRASAFSFFEPLYFLSAEMSDAGTGTSRSSLFLGLNP